MCVATGGSWKCCLMFLKHRMTSLPALDMGHGQLDDTREVQRYEQPSLNTTKNLIKEMDTHDFIIDVGDISYADGYEPIVSSRAWLQQPLCNNCFLMARQIVG